MTEQDPAFETLNAYIDGELPEEAKASIDQLLAGDEKLIGQLEALRRLKSGVADMGADYVIIQMPPSRRWLAPGPLGAAAAMIMLAFAGSWFVATTFIPDVTNGIGPSVEQALKVHDGSPTAWMTGSAPATNLHGFDVPDLAAAGLTLVTLDDKAEIAGRRAIQAGYLGRHGCRLSLFRIAEAGGDMDFQLAEDDAAQSAVWADQSFWYVTVARKLDMVRFAVLADLLKHLTTRSVRPPSLDVVALLKSVHQPCSG